MTDLPQRFWDRVNKDGPLWQGTPCWIWTGDFYRKGYGRFRGKRAHRLAYEALVGPFPPGLESDHLCRNRACVNPAHIEPVTRAVNAQRGLNAQSLKTHCPKGHAYTPENTIIEHSGTRSYRRCRICQRERRAGYRAQHKNT